MSAQQTEIPIPAQPARVTLGRARAIRNELEKYLATERPQYATDITVVAMRFDGADQTYRKIRHGFYRRRRLDELHIVAQFITALESPRKKEKIAAELQRRHDLIYQPDGYSRDRWWIFNTVVDWPQSARRRGCAYHLLTDPPLRFPIVAPMTDGIWFHRGKEARGLGRDRVLVDSRITREHRAEFFAGWDAEDRLRGAGPSDAQRAESQVVLQKLKTFAAGLRNAS